MKKKIREINVHDEIYVWKVSYISPNYVCIKIWIPGFKNIPWLHIRYRFDDPWLHFGELITGKPEKIKEVFQLESVKPKLIAKIITEVRQRNTVPTTVEKTLNYQLTPDGELEAIENAGIAGESPWV